VIKTLATVFCLLHNQGSRAMPLLIILQSSCSDSLKND
jgi:hypothetical protein